MKKNISLSIIIQYLLLMINPILSIFFVMYQFILNRKVSAFVIAFSISLIFIYFPLMYDTSSNYYATFSLQNSDHSYFEIRLYNLFAFLLKKYFDIDFMYFILLTSTFSIYLWIKISNNYNNLIIANNNKIYIFMFVFFSIIYRDIMDLNRFYFATSIFLFILFIYDNKQLKFRNYPIFLFLSIIAIEIHSATIIFILLFMSVYFFKLRFIYSYWYPILMLLFGIISQNILLAILDLPIINTLDFVQLGKSYLSSENKWGVGSLNLYDKMQRFLEIIAFLVIFILGNKLLKTDTYKNDKVIKFSLLFIGIVLFFISYKSLYERYSLALFLFSSFIIYKSLLGNKVINIFQTIFLITLILRFILINFFMYGIIFTDKYMEILPNSNKKEEMILKPFYLFTPYLLDLKEHGYSDKYIRNESTRGRKYLHKYSLNPALRGINLE